MLTVYQISYGYVSQILDYESFNFWEVLNFYPDGGFLQITLFLRIIHQSYLKVLKTIDFSCVPNFLFRDCL